MNDSKQVLNIKGFIINFIITFILTFTVVVIATPRFTKPVIYLYPLKPTDVSIKLDPVIKLNIDIPKYDSNKGWKVLAQPDGTLKDLQPELTDCNKIDSTKFGLEYDKKACQQNKYPYIYWEGINSTQPLPDSKDGWIVKKGEIKSFLNARLDDVGFNQKEKKDFLEYWVPKLTSLNEDQLFIYFLQNDVLDKYLPETITPRPDYNNRFYIVVKTGFKPATSLKPQPLKKFIRKGFYVVDWGGAIDY